MDFHAVEKKWQQNWEKAKLFEAGVDKKKKKFFVTFPYPYVNGAPHVGHSFSSFRVDCYARFKRMQGYNVLFPQGFHATGEPIVGVVERLNKGDKNQEQTLKDFGATDRDIIKFKKSAEFLAKFWKKRWIEDLKAAGFSIDWRRTFITSQITPTYSRFIEWQYNTLRRLGFVAQGTHPVIWCPHDHSPTGDHDRLEGEGESPIEYTILKFELINEKNTFFPAATLRPETIYGVTNMWINPDVDYVVAQVGKEKWVVSEFAAQKLADQQKDVLILKKVCGAEFLRKRLVEPISRKEIVILPAHFVDPENTTGVVMSVPSHAPYDWIALKEILDNPEEMERYGVTKEELEPISIIRAEGLGEHPAIEAVDKFGIKSSKQKDLLDQATSEVYKKEFHQGVLKGNTGEWAGRKVSEVKQELIDHLKESGIADTMWETTGTVVCRCTTKCHVKILENQWFLRFSDPVWKERTRKCLAQMKIYPNEVRNNFENTIEWLKDKACARKGGLGTPVPWDKGWIIETLSDSTIYMAYYTISKIINENKIVSTKLTDEVFDFIFLGKGKPEQIARKSKLKLKLLKEMRREFEYFYPVDFRGSAKDLVQNHLTFYMFHHTAIWNKEKWPQSIGVNGYVNVEGEKMSKSRGNVIPFKDLLKQYGADLVRLNIAGSAEGLEDADWRAENIKSYRARLQFIEELINKIKKFKKEKYGRVEKYLMSRLQDIIKKTTNAYENLNMRIAISTVIFDGTGLLKYYLERGGNNKQAIETALKTIVKLVAPAAPHVCEELWSTMGQKGFVSIAEWPAVDRKLINKSVEAEEDYIAKVIDDIKSVVAMLSRKRPFKPAKIMLFVCAPWKFEVYNRVMTGAKLNDLMKDEKMKAHGNAIVAFIQRLEKRKPLEDVFLSSTQEFEILKEYSDLLEKKFSTKIEIVSAAKSQHPKAAAAEPGKPGIVIE